MTVIVLTVPMSQATYSKGTNHRLEPRKLVPEVHQIVDDDSVRVIELDLLKRWLALGVYKSRGRHATIRCPEFTVALHESVVTLYWSLFRPYHLGSRRKLAA